MGITGLLPFIEKASRRTNVSEFSGCTVAIDSYCWLHKGAFACADRLVRGEETDVHIKYCLKYVTMLLSKNIKPILVFDGRHLPAKALTESKRRESRQTSKKRAAELLSLGKVEEARSYIRRSVDITHEMALALIQECRKRNVDCIVAPYEADAQLAYLNIKNIAQVVITEDSDLILFGCTKVLFKMDLTGTGTLVETVKLPLVMRCPIESYSFSKFRRMCIMSGCDYLPSLPGVGLAKARQFVTASNDPDFANLPLVMRCPIESYSFSKFRRMCIMSGCDYLASLPGVGLAKARQFVTASNDPDFVNALKKLPSYLNKPTLIVTDEYRESFLKAEATFKHQYVYDPLERRMVRLSDPDDEDVEKALCVNAGEILEPDIAFQLALGNLDPFTLRKMDDWHPDLHRHTQNGQIKTNGWKEQAISNHPSIWTAEFKQHTDNACPWHKEPKKPNPVISQTVTRPRKKVVNLIVPETQDESLSIETLKNMYCIEPSTKRQKIETNTQIPDEEIVRKSHKSPILENKQRSFIKCLRNGDNNNILKRLSRFPRTVIDQNIVESKFFPSANDNNKTVEESPERNRNPFKINSERNLRSSDQNDDESPCFTSTNNNNKTVEKSPERKRNPFKINSERTNLRMSDQNHDESPFKGQNSDSIIDTDLTHNKNTYDEKNLHIDLTNSQKENSPCNSPKKSIYNNSISPNLTFSPKKSTSPILGPSPRVNPFKCKRGVQMDMCSQDSIIENTYPMETLITPMDTQESFGQSQRSSESQPLITKPVIKKSNCRVSGLKRTTSLPNNQPTLLSKFGFQKKPVLKR